MKGLLLKDWYMLKAYCRNYLLIAFIFFGVAFFSEDNLMFLFYPDTDLPGSHVISDCHTSHSWNTCIHPSGRYLWSILASCTEAV